MHLPVTTALLVMMSLTGATLQKLPTQEPQTSAPSKRTSNSTLIQDLKLINKSSTNPVAGLPINAPRPVFYHLPNALAPSCGLVTAGGKKITPILEVGPGESYPQCLEVVDGAKFDLRNQHNYVFKYRQRDTKEDTSTAYFFVQEDKHGLRPLDALNRATPPRNLSTKDIAAWAKRMLLATPDDHVSSHPAPAGKKHDVQPPEARPDKLHSGVYENLALAVTPSGDLIGRYEESQGIEVSKNCSFYLKGKAAVGEATTITWSNRVLPGSIKAVKGGVELTVQDGGKHAGCGLVLLPQISQGLSLDLIKQTTWLDLRTVPGDGAKLFAKPMASGQVIGTVPGGATVGVLDQKGEWLLVESTRLNSKQKGWIPTAQTKTPAPPLR